MYTDATLNLIPPSAPLSLVVGAGVSPTSAVLDLLGQGVGTAPQAVIGTSPTFGIDFGIGDNRVELAIAIGTSLATSNGATLNVALQLAPDTGAAGGYQPGTWQTVGETGPMTVAECASQNFVARFPWLPSIPEGLQPRYAQLLFQIPPTENFTAGTIAYAVITTDRDDLAQRFAPRNYVGPTS
jgi:hypothetical protein